MNDEYKEKLLKEFESLQTKIKELEKIINLIKSSNEVSAASKLQTITFLEGYMKGLKENLEWLNCIIPWGFKNGMWYCYTSLPLCYYNICML